jgi:hypothetical protein
LILHPMIWHVKWSRPAVGRPGRRPRDAVARCPEDRSTRHRRAGGFRPTIFSANGRATSRGNRSARRPAPRCLRIPLPACYRPDTPPGFHPSAGATEDRTPPCSLGQETVLGSHHHDLAVPGCQLFLLLPQLREVGPAGQSTQMPVKDHKQPYTGIILQPVNAAGGIWELKRHSSTVHQVHFLSMPPVGKDAFPPRSGFNFPGSSKASAKMFPIYGNYP